MSTAPVERGPAPVLLGVVALAALLRWLAYSGFFGSDEVTYTAQAFKLLDGDWSVDPYVGANRMGVNLPVAGIAALLGRNELAAALYSLAASVAEVALVCWVAWRMFGPRVALTAGVLLASLPTHVHFAGRLMADAPLCLTVTAAFVLFYEAELRRWAVGYFLAGVCLGLSYWIKPPLIVFVGMVFLVVPLVVRRLDARWAWMAAGTALVVLANGLLFLALTGNFWYVFDSVRERQVSGYLEAGVAAGEMATGVGFYLSYLFRRIYHTGLLGYLAAAALALAWLRRSKLDAPVRLALAYTAWWAAGLLLVHSLFPVSMRPLVFVPKQVNYMLILLAPLAVLGAWALAQLPPRWGTTVTALLAGGGVLLALMSQASVAVFTANSWATLRYAQEKPGAVLFVMSNASRAASFQALTGGEDLRARVLTVRHWNDVVRPDNDSTASSDAPAAPRYAVIDEETYGWDGSRPFPRAQDVPSCWVAVGVLEAQPQGLGVVIVRALASLPGVATSTWARRLERMARPLPARVYRLPPGNC